ncbi:hypothetical protein ACQEU3_23935 [Spirillospora sp. CA-253888]
MSPSAAPPAAAPSSAASSAAPAAGGTPLNATGASVTLPPGWKQVDPTQDASPVVQTSFRLTGDLGSLTKELLGKQKEQGIAFAIDTSVTSGFAPILTVGCDRGGLTGSSLEQLKAKATAMHKGARLTDLTVGGRPGFKATYTSPGRDGITTDEATVRVPIPGDRFCFVDLSAKQGAMPPQAEQILASFKPA